MRKLLIGLGGVAAGLLLVALVGVWLLFHLGGRLDNEARAYVDDVVPKIVASWRSTDLLARASPELLASAPAEKVDAIFRTFAVRLGALRHYQGSQGQANVNYWFGQGRTTTATFAAVVIFEWAPATIYIQAIRRDGRWCILQVVVNSEALLPG